MENQAIYSAPTPHPPSTGPMAAGVLALKELKHRLSVHHAEVKSPATHRPGSGVKCGDN